MDRLPGRHSHIASRLDHHIVFTAGFDRGSTHSVWTYNLYTDQWREHKIPATKNAPYPVIGACAATIDECIYMFGGLDTHSLNTTNAVWKLTSKYGCFHWSEIEFQRDVRLPFPRFRHSGWEYANCLWAFGGDRSPFSYGPLDQYLNDHGDLESMRGGAVTNQLICFNPSTHTWTNPQCFGTLPSPRSDHSTAIINNNVWLVGGEGPSNIFDDFFKFDMPSKTWTCIQTTQAKPQVRLWSTLTAISDSQLVCHGGEALRFPPVIDTYIVDLPSNTWRYHKSVRDNERCNHSASLGLNKNVIIVGGRSSFAQPTPTFQLMLEPKSLKQVAMKTIYSQRKVLPWKNLPSKLIMQLGLLQNEEARDIEKCPGVPSYASRRRLLRTENGRNTRFSDI